MIGLTGLVEGLRPLGMIDTVGIILGLQRDTTTDRKSVV